MKQQTMMESEDMTSLLEQIRQEHLRAAQILNDDKETRSEEFYNALVNKCSWLRKNLVSNKETFMKVYYEGHGGKEK